MKYKEVKQLLTKEILLDIYPTNSDTMILEKFNIHIRHLVKLLEEYNIPRHNKQENTELTCLYRYGVPDIAKVDKFKEKKAQTCLNKYGVKSYLATKDAEIKQQQSVKEKYGVDNVFQLESIKEKSRQTKIKKYNNPTFTNPEKMKLTKLELYGDSGYVNKEKAEQTLIDKYGTTNIPSIPFIKEKIQKTNMERYNTPYFCTTDKCRKELLHKKDSKPNKEFEQKLKDNNISFSREFSLKNYYYDFKVNNILIEINPSATHNSTFGLYNKAPLDKYYHYKKSLTAVQNGYYIINIFDWDNQDEIINNYLKQDYKSYISKNIDLNKCFINFTEDPKEVKLTEHEVYLNNKTKVIVYDAGIISF